MEEKAVLGVFSLRIVENIVKKTKKQMESQQQLLLFTILSFFYRFK